jgi:hypothetical protein
MHDFDRAGGRDGVPVLASTGFGRGESKNGAEALATREDGVAHSLVHGFGTNGDTGEKPVEGIINENLLAFEISFEVGHGAEPNRKFGQGNRLLRTSGKELRLRQ